MSHKVTASSEINIILGKDNKVLDRDLMKVFCIDDAKLTEAEKITARILAEDGWYGSYKEMIECARKL